MINSYDTVVFVCSGNIIRSAFCELYAKHRGLAKEVISIGTTYHNRTIHPKSREKLLELGVPAYEIEEFRPTHISEHSHRESMVYLVMTTSHIEDLVSNGIPEEHIHLLSEVGGDGTEIEDPYFTGEYERVFRALRSYVDKL